MSELKRQIMQPSDKISDSLMAVNQLSYRLPPEIGVARRRTQTVDLFQQSSYAGGNRMILDCQTGSSFVNGRNSFLTFKCAFTLTGTTTAGDWGIGSAVNVIREVLVKGRGGQEICRVERANLLTRMRTDWEKPTDWRNAQGGMMGYSSLTAGGTYGNKADLKTATRYAIPLHLIAPVFDQQRLMPPQLMSGLQIQIVLEGATLAAFCTGNVDNKASDYSITEPEIWWDTVELADQFSRRINEVAASKGLNLIHKEWFHQPTSTSVGTANFEVRKAASKALKFIYNTRLTADLASPVQDSLGAETFKYTQFQTHIGADYFPVSRLSGDGAGDTSRFYAYSLMSYDMMSGSQAPTLGYSRYTTAVTTGACPSNVVASFNKSGVTDLDGYQINNSRSLVVDCAYSDSASRTIDAYLCHLRALKVYQSGVDVKD